VMVQTQRLLMVHALIGLDAHIFGSLRSGLEYSDALEFYGRPIESRRRAGGIQIALFRSLLSLKKNGCTFPLAIVKGIGSNAMRVGSWLSH
jgi:hypothetical protein